MKIESHWRKPNPWNDWNRPNPGTDWSPKPIRAPLTWPTSTDERAIAQLRVTVKDQKQEIDYLRKLVESLVDVIIQGKARD